MADIPWIGEVVAVRIAVKVYELLRREQGFHILQSRLGGGEQAHSGVQKECLEPLLFEGGQGRMRRSMERRAEIPGQKRPAPVRELGGDCDEALAKRVFHYGAGQGVPRQRSLHRLGEDRGHRPEVSPVDFGKDHSSSPPPYICAMRRTSP